MKRYLALLMVCGWCAASALAAPRQEHAKITGYRGDGTIILNGNVEAVLVGVALPDPAAAEGWMARYAGRMIDYRTLGTDRYGRPRIVANLTPEETIQQSMIRDGVALAYSSSALPEILRWMKEEQMAAARRRGIWNTLRITPEKSSGSIGAFRLVEGKVTRIYVGYDATYVNFGADWKTDFSVTIPKRVLRDFNTMLNSVTGKKVRVRGFIHEENGPMITITRPEQLEVLDAQP